MPEGEGGEARGVQEQVKRVIFAGQIFARPSRSTASLKPLLLFIIFFVKKARGQHPADREWRARLFSGLGYPPQAGNQSDLKYER